LASGNNSAIRQATTNEKGVFTIRELPITQRLGLFVSANGYETYNRQVASSNRLADILLQPGAERLDSLRWKEAEEANTPAAYQAYLDDFPNGIFASEARQIVDELTSYNENRLWEAATASDSIANYQAYLAEYPNGAYADDARRRIDEIQTAREDDADWAAAQRANTPEACRGYLDKWPQGRHREAAAACAQPPIANYVKPEMVFVKGGTFEMGDVMGDDEYESEKPVHEVRLNDFYIGKYEVTFEEFDAFCNATKRQKPDDRGWGRGRRPVINVSWYDAVEYCNWLSEKEGLQKVYTINKDQKDPNNTNSFDDLKWTISINWKANGYRLPSEAEWEYAARQGGQKVRFGNGKDIADPEEINYHGGEDYKKNYSKTGVYRGETVPVGSLKSPNSLGLHDMSGNVWEWCWDWYDGDYYAASPPNDPKGPDTGSSRVGRGGSWFGSPRSVRAALRVHDSPGGSGDNVGFRLARAAR
jgi:formylglycine-generating enzyme required for sulfatase activity